MLIALKIAPLNIGTQLALSYQLAIFYKIGLFLSFIKVK